MKLKHELLVFIVVFAALGVLGKMDIADEISREADEKEARPWRVIGATVFEEARALKELAHPLPCERWLAQWGPGERPKPRCVKYSPVSSQ